MSTPATPSPAKAPAQNATPKEELVFKDVWKETERELVKLKVELEVDDNKVATEQKEYKKVEEFFRENKNKILKVSQTEIGKIRVAIQDKNEELEGKLQITDGKLELKENDTNTEKKSTDTAETAETTPIDTETQGARDFFVASGLTFEEPQTKAPNFMNSFMNKIRTMWYDFLEGFGIDVRNQKAQVEWYTGFLGKQKTEATFGALEEYMGDSVKSISDIAEREQITQKIEQLGLPIKHIKQIISLIFTGGNEVQWSEIPDSVDGDIIKLIRGKYLTLRDSRGTLAEMSTKEKLDAIFTIEEDKKGDYLTRYEEDKRERDEWDAPAEIAPEVAAEANEEAPEATTSLTEILSKYDGKPYDEKWEQPSNDTIFTFEQDDIFLSIKRWDKKEAININPDGKLTYRDITGTPEMIIQLARLDMYADSLPGKLQLSADENAIEKSYTDIDGQWISKKVVTASINEMPAFLEGWDWQKLYNFLLRDDERQIAPAEATEMSGEKPASITQEDIDILMKRTDTRESEDMFLGIDWKYFSEDARFSWKIEQDTSISVLRTNANGEKSFQESIFPNPDGTFTVGNVRFPRITDAVKAANMRNWVRWYEGKWNELQKDGDNIEANWIIFDTAIIKDWKIPDFLTHGILPETGNALTNIDDIYNFLKGAVIDDGIYGKNKTRKQWESEKANNQV